MLPGYNRPPARSHTNPSRDEGRVYEGRVGSVKGWGRGYACAANEGNREREDGGDGRVPARFDGITAAVTGGANGIGRAVAAGFLAEGANVVVVDLVEPPETLRGPRFEAVVGDVADERIAERAVGTALGRFGELDVLVNDAAAYPDAAARRHGARRLAAGLRRQRDRAST